MVGPTDQNSANKETRIARAASHTDGAGLTGCMNLEARNCYLCLSHFIMVSKSRNAWSA